jgi:hypothetical protein
MGKGLEFKGEIEVASCPNLEIQKKLQKTPNQKTIAKIFQPTPQRASIVFSEGSGLTSPTMFLYIGLFILYALSCQKPNPIFL